MTMLVWLTIVVGILAIPYLYAYCEKKLIARKARKRCDEMSESLLNVGCRFSDFGDVNCDIAPRKVKDFVQCDVHRLPFKNKSFGAAVCTCVLEHVDDPEDAERELKRAATEVFIVLPKPFFPHEWLVPSHKWLFFGGRKIRINPILNNLVFWSLVLWIAMS
ncbi:MAG: methyltransferase domain-containing protein [Methanocellales archaeon]|nr:methyltransferase domain-containing protein [Methanocellales archaeon]